jgi:3alpha(or 20beta)-hydroxysteroid dehydrogenase
MNRLQGKVVLITGAAAGMGAEHGRLFVEEGAKVILTDVDSASGNSVAAELGENALFLSHDVSDAGSWASVVREGTAAFGTITVLVNNAGISGPYADTAELDDETFRRIIAVNQAGVFYGMRAVLPGMVAAGGGSIVNISSGAGMAHMSGTPNGAYTASKFAVRGMTKAAAIEYAARKVRVNSVHPGAILTPMAKGLNDQAELDRVAKIVPMGRFGDPREVSYVVLFLASDESSYMTGSELVVDGGRFAE